MDTKVYKDARIAGYQPAQALRIAKLVERWVPLAESLVRIRLVEEHDSYFDVYGEPEGYTDINGKRYTSKMERKSIEESIERNGCWMVCAEWSDGSGWHMADSVGMCVYDNPEDWRENWYIPDLMESALKALQNLDNPTIANLSAELRRCVDLLDGPCTMPDGSNADTRKAHALLGDFAS